MVRLKQGSTNLFLESPASFCSNSELVHHILIISWLMNWSRLVRHNWGWSENQQDSSSPGPGTELEYLALKYLLFSFASFSFPSSVNQKETFWGKEPWVLSSNASLHERPGETVQVNRERLLRLNQGKALRGVMVSVRPDPLWAEAGWSSIFNCKVIWLGEAEGHWGGRNVAANTLWQAHRITWGGAAECVWQHLGQQGFSQHHCWGMYVWLLSVPG